MNIKLIHHITLESKTNCGGLTRIHCIYYIHRMLIVHCILLL